MEPKDVPTIEADEQAQLVLQLNWDDKSRILQEESRLSEGDVPAIRWSTLKDAADEDIHIQFPEADRNLLLLMRTDDLHNLQWLSKIRLFKVKARRLDILVEVKQDTPLLPAAADIKQHIPVPVRRVCHLSRPLAMSGLTLVYGILWLNTSHQIERQAWLPSSFQCGCLPQGISLRAAI